MSKSKILKSSFESLSASHMSLSTDILRFPFIWINEMKAAIVAFIISGLFFPSLVFDANGL